MKEEQIDMLIGAIKNTYPTFSLTKGVINEWTKRLLNYDFEDVERNFNNYVLSGNTQPITIVDLIRGLQTKEQKEPINGMFFCMKCKRRYNTIEEMEKCYERDMDIAYIKKMSDKFGIKYTEYFGNLYDATLEDINKNYNNFIIRLVEEQEKKGILKGYELLGLNAYYEKVVLKKE